MIRRVPKERSGITLTEILISILILGVGLISLATLFPLGLLRLREAARLSRSGYLTESGTADLGVRNLLSKNSFLNPYYGPWYATTPSGRYDPWLQDTPAAYTDWGLPAAPVGAFRRFGAGLTVAYDPLWRYQTGVYLDSTVPQPEARFASGIAKFVRDDPSGPGTVPSAHGLQRITNFNPALSSVNTVPEIFVSPEDIVLQGEDGAAGAAGASPLVPEMLPDPAGSAVPTYAIDWRFTWMFTGHQTDSNTGTVFDGDLVVFENRPFGIDLVPTVFGGTTPVVAGETVVEAVFGFSGTVTDTTGTRGYGAGARRVVLLRWPADPTMPDPDVKTGNWIADVTYERNSATDMARTYTNPSAGGATVYYPYQRCYWYQIVKRTVPGAAMAFPGDGGRAYRSMTVWVSHDLKARTLLDSSTSPVSPYHVNAALISPYVVNVFPRTVYTR